MKTIHYFILPLVFAFANLQVHAQNVGSFKGLVVDKQTQQPLIGVVVTLAQQNLTVVTDTNGIFIIKEIPEGAQNVVLNYIGYQVKTLTEIQIVRKKTYYTTIEMIEDIKLANEVTVVSHRFENDPTVPVSSYSFSREEIFRNPGAQGDIFRAIGILPGVSSSGGQFSAIAVRGQGTAENVYMVDDIPMTDLSHLEGNSSGFNDPNGGRFSIFAPRVIDNAQFQGGGFAAQFGRRSSSYLSLGVKEGNRESSFVSGQFDLLGFTMIYDGPSKVHKKTSVFASARYQHFGLLLNMLKLDYLGVPSYSDFMIKTTTDINAKNKFSILAMYNPESFYRDINNMKKDKNLENIDLPKGYQNKATVSFNLRTLIGKSSFIKNVAYFQYYDAKFNVGRSNPLVDAEGRLANASTITYQENLRKINLAQSTLGYRFILNKQFKTSTLTAGVDAAYHTINNSRYLSRADTSYILYSDQVGTGATYSVVLPIFFDSQFNKGAFNGSSYADYSFQPIKRLTINAGLRYDYTGFTEYHSVAPRLSGSYRLTEKNSINFAYGLFYQDPQAVFISDQEAGKRLKNELTTQYIIGFKRYFSPDTKLVIEGWYKQFTNQIVRTTPGTKLLTNDGTGYAYGIDVNVTKRLSKKYYGQAGYTYMQSKRDDKDGRGVYDFTFSQPHIVSMLASYKPNDKWVFSGKFRYATGRPTDQYYVLNNVFNNDNFVRSTQVITDKNGKRLNDFISLDFRVDYRVQFNKLTTTAFVDIVNVMNRRNQNSEMLMPVNGRTVYDGVAIFPTFGIRVEY